MFPVAETRTTAQALPGYEPHDSARWVEEPPTNNYRSDFEPCAGSAPKRRSLRPTRTTSSAPA